MASAPPTQTAPTALQGLGRMAAWRQVVMLVAIAGSVALGVGVALWSQEPNYSLLYGNLSARESSEIVDALTQAGIEFKVDYETGGILVPTARVGEARMQLASQDLPNGTAMGMEMLDQKQSFGTSQFIERARYQRALEEELSRTISALSNVESARVHLALPRQSPFLKRNRPPSASVLVQLAAGRKLAEGQAAAIAHLVAAAVPSLELEQVRVVDGKGRLLTEPAANDRLGLSRRELDYTRDLEERYVERIEAILMPVLGPDGVKAQVVADVDYSMYERSQESFNPDTPALRSEQVLEERNAGGAAGGIPGALTNQPPGAAQVPEGDAGGGIGEQPGGGGQELRANARGRDRARTRQTRNFEVDRTVSHTMTPSGRLRRLSVAVVVDDRRTISPEGTVTRVPRSPEEITRFTSLVQDAIGFLPARGDTVNVINASFNEPEAQVAIPDLPWWQQPWAWDLARQAGGVLLVLFLAFGVFRPVMRSLVAREVTERELEQARVVAAQLPAPGEEGEGGGRDSLPDRAANEQRVDAIGALVDDDPRRVANLMRSWVGDDG